MWLPKASPRVGFQAVLATGVFFGVAIAAAGVSSAVDRSTPSDVLTLAHSALTSPYCGIGLAPVSPARLPDKTGQGRGVLIASVVPESPAAKAGLKTHDVVIRYDHQDVYSPEQLMKLVQDDEPGRDIVVTFLRAGKVLETKMTLSQWVVGGDVRAARAAPSGEQPRFFPIALPRTWQGWLDAEFPSFQSASTAF
jgi:S1-C subfamily serine protease